MKKLAYLIIAAFVLSFYSWNAQSPIDEKQLTDQYATDKDKTSSPGDKDGSGHPHKPHEVEN